MFYLIISVISVSQQIPLKDLDHQSISFSLIFLLCGTQLHAMPADFSQKRKSFRRGLKYFVSSL